MHLRTVEKFSDIFFFFALHLSKLCKQFTIYINTKNYEKIFTNSMCSMHECTQIKFYVPERVNTALLCIYDLQGKQLKQTVITQRGNGVETVYASEFAAGIYLYALIAEGNQVDVKKMILTE